MKNVAWSETASKATASILLAGAIAAAPGTLHAQGGPPSVPAMPTQDVYAILGQNPGLAATLPFYQQPQVTGRFSSITVIGDSYGDQGNALRYNPVSSQVGANGRYGNALNIIDALQYHYGLPTGSITNYAFGGATTGSVNNNPPPLQLPGFSQQVQALQDSGRRFGIGDLVTLTTAGPDGGNDTPLGISVAQGTANVVGYLNTLVGLGARNILLDSQTHTGTASLQAALAPFTSQGVTVTLFDGATLVDSILAAPRAYGFATDATALDYCTRLGGTHICNEGGINKARAQTTAEILAEDQYLFFYAHPTTALASLIAQGEANLLDAQAVPEPSSLAMLGCGLLVAAASAGRKRTL